MSRFGSCHSQYCSNERNSFGCVKRSRASCVFFILGEGGGRARVQGALTTQIVRHARPFSAG